MTTHANLGPLYPLDRERIEAALAQLEEVECETSRFEIRQAATFLRRLIRDDDAACEAEALLAESGYGEVLRRRGTGRFPTDRRR